MALRSLLAIACASFAAAHSGHQNSKAPQVDENASWMAKHMAEEHHLDSWDEGSFFGLHDYNSDNQWSGDEILRTYGLMDESNKNVPQSRRDEIVQQVLDLMDTDRDGQVSRDEWRRYMEGGNTLPDMNTGPGHHGDDEYEYEIHHWEKYHDENTKLEDLTHPEDIEHFKKHEEMERVQEKLEQMDQMDIIVENIPLKFRKIQRQ
ncbi:EF hand domain-containing protein [Sarocladium implicatum]|nr:EF hand domain-containing protein [Sarocladium implicatum]